MANKTWRPEGWKNPYMPKTRYEEIQVTHKGWPKTDAVMTFEAGADAMLEALRNIGAKVNKGEAPILYYVPSKGTLVFIPDDAT